MAFLKVFTTAERKRVTMIKRLKLIWRRLTRKPLHYVINIRRYGKGFNDEK